MSAGFPTQIESPASKKRKASTRKENFATSTPLGISAVENKNLIVTTSTRVRHKQTAGLPTWLQTDPTPKTEHVMKTEHMMKKESSIKKVWKTKKEPSSSPKPKLGLINGYYKISCPKLEGSFSDAHDKFFFILGLDSLGVRGAYDFALFPSIVHLEQ